MISELVKQAQGLQLIDHIPIGLFAIREDFSVAIWNQQIERWSGVSKASIINKPIQSYFPNFGKIDIQMRIQMVFEIGTPVLLTSLLHKNLLKTQHVDHKNMDLELKTTITPVFDNESFALFTIQNVTQYQEFLKDFNKKRNIAMLGMRESHNNSEFMQRKNQEIMHLYKELDQFTSLASHDLKEPLRKVKTFGERLKNHLGENLDTRANDYLDRMLNATDRMEGLLKGLLELSRVRSKPGEFQKVNIWKTINDVLRDLEIHIEQSNGIVDVSVDKDMEVFADQIQIRQLFQNLISNALKFVEPNKTPKLKVTVELDATSENEFYEITVQDNGIGIDQKHFEDVFKPFERLNSRQSYEGSGMGLAICKKIVDRHYGTIRISSEKNNGSIFKMRLPMDPASSEDLNSVKS